MTEKTRDIHTISHWNSVTALRNTLWEQVKCLDVRGSSNIRCSVTEHSKTCLDDKTLGMKLCDFQS